MCMFGLVIAYMHKDFIAEINFVLVVQRERSGYEDAIYDLGKKEKGVS